ncbi:MAG TPA: hypothetical protein DCE41_25980 [Cytophagales bacterium]|nr:hypothetical protein [Cytophagales bacterium]HAA18336.1 hypothetical protein [Cytophagales bacterium]HAP57965.1 hypothetical protein [Cytophagales bacterium]
MQYATISLPEPGIMLIDYHNIEPTEEQFEAYLDEVTAFMKEHHNNIVIMDGTHGKFLPAKLRIRQGEWIKEHYDFLKQNSPLNIYVVTNMIVKMMMRGVFVVQKPPTPHKVVTSREEALNIARKFWQENPREVELVS